MKSDQILLDHGSGGKNSHRLTIDVLLPALGNDILDRLHDGALLSIDGCRLAFSTDSYVVDPIFFPGGSIGDLAVNGTINDISMCGAEPRFLSVAFIIEEGLPMADFKRIVEDIATAARTAGVMVVTGDTKVVPKGAADKIFINTSGIGVIPPGVAVDGANARPGDRVLLSGTIADHGVTVLTQREGLRFEGDIRSDTAPLHRMVASILAVCPEIHVLRDPTRGGIGTSLNEIAGQSGVEIRMDEAAIPIRPEVAGLCELLGLDPLHIANEGKLLAIVPADRADAVLSVMHADPFGKAARIIGTVGDGRPGRVIMTTRIGGHRIVDMLTGEQLPRIC